MRYYAAVFALYSLSVKPKQQNGLQNKFPRTKLYLAMWFDLQLGQNIVHKYPKYINNHISGAVFPLFSPFVKPKQHNGLQNKIPGIKLYLTM